MKQLFSLCSLILLGLLTGAPSYNAGNPLLLTRGQSVNLLFNEDPTSGSFSQQFYAPTDIAQPTMNLSFEFRFSASPGTFNYQIQDADTDATGNYVTIPTAGTITSCPQTPGGAYTCRVELNPWRALYGRIYTNTQNSNSVNLTVQVTR